MIKSLFLKYILFIGVISMLFSIDGVAQTLPEKENDTIIVWTKNRKLNWGDFQGVKKNKVPESIASKSSLSIDFIPVSINKSYFGYVIFSSFYKKKSFSSTTNPLVLKHEQLHFDIAELFARKIRKKIIQLTKQNITPEKYQRVVESIFKNYYLYQEEYDLETEHSLNSKKQKKWEKKIAAELQSTISLSSEIFK